MLIQPPGCHIQ